MQAKFYIDRKNAVRLKILGIKKADNIPTVCFFYLVKN